MIFVVSCELADGEMRVEKLLRQSEIDALFAAIAEQPDAAAPGVRATAYNFGFAGEISNGQMRGLTAVNDQFARNLMYSVGAWLGTEFQVALVSGEQMGFAEFLERVPENTYLSSVRLEPLGTVGLMEVELTLASAMVDVLLGGTGRAEAARPLTDIENAIMGSVAKAMMKELNVAWQPVGLEFALDKQEAAAKVAGTMAAGEKMLCLGFEVRMPYARGAVNLCLPAAVLSTMMGKLGGEDGRPRRREAEVRARVRELVGESTLTAVLQFPAVRLRAWELAMLVPGATLRLPLPRHAASELRVSGVALGAARPVKVGEHRGARMEAPGAVPGTTRQDGAMRI